MCMIPHEGIMFSLFSQSLVWPFVEFRVGNEKRSILVPHISESKTRSNGENKSYNQIKMCMCVEFSGWNSHPFLHNSIFYLSLEIWAIFPFISFSSLFFLPMLLGTDIYIFFSFCIAHIFLHDEYKESCQRDGAFFSWTEGIFMRNF